MNVTGLTPIPKKPRVHHEDNSQAERCPSKEAGAKIAYQK